ncbi:hypothetical protein PQX77_010549 [Marasmius sp. AFHP31]|nr:hypothetical protein PQX77_010549 [Marasmius sp. AFHP31]
MGLFSKLKLKENNFFGAGSSSAGQPSDLPPEWAPAQEEVHQWGLYNEATDEDYKNGIDFCERFPMNLPRLLPSRAVDVINQEGCRAWGIQQPSQQEYRRFSGKVTNISSKGTPVVLVETDSRCGDFCLMSDLPIMAGLYDATRQTGVYFEVKINKIYIPESFLAIGTTCQPYPSFRLPGWNRESAGFHLDDLRKFFEDSDGGRDYPVPFDRIRAGDVIGCGYEFASGTLFYTWNGVRLENAFNGLYLPRTSYDVFAAIGVHGATQFEVNFGGDVFKWKEGNEWQWKVDAVMRRLGDTSRLDDELPVYSA